MELWIETFEQPTVVSTTSTTQQISTAESDLMLKRMYFKDEKNNRIFILKDSPVGGIASTLMHAKQSQLTASHLSLYPIPFCRLGRDIISVTQSNWAHDFKTKFGKLGYFIRQHSEVIFVQENNQTPMNPFVQLAPSIDDFEIILVGDVEFSKAFFSTQKYSFVGSHY